MPKTNRTTHKTTGRINNRPSKAATDDRIKTDIILPIYPEHVENISKGIKDHEFRKYLLSSSIRRFWIYETSPTSAITYIATVSNGKKHGVILDPNGLKNAEFNKPDGTMQGRYAYEILKLEKLQVPITLARLKAEGWARSAQGWCFVKKAMDHKMKEAKRTLVFDRLPVVPEGESNDKPSSKTIRDFFTRSTATSSSKSPTRSA